MGRLTLVTGGAASGKSSHALRMAARWGERILFVATCVPRDAEMHAKVSRHQAERPHGWMTVEATRQLAEVFQPGFDGAVVDCLTLLTSQMLIEDTCDGDILAEVKKSLRSGSTSDVSHRDRHERSRSRRSARTSAGKRAFAK